MPTKQQPRFVPISEYEGQVFSSCDVSTGPAICSVREYVIDQVTCIVLRDIGRIKSKPRKRKGLQ